MGLTPISGRITLRTERDGVCTGEQTSQNIMCNGGLGELASALAWSAAQDQGSLIGAIANYMTPFYGAVGSGAYPPFNITGAINSGSTQVTQVSPNQVTFTGNVTSGSNTVTSVSSTTGISVGMTLTDTLRYIPPGAQVTAIVGTTLTLSANATNTTTSAETINGYYPLSPGMIIEATSGIPLYTTISSYSPSTNTVTMSKAATGDTMINAAALDTLTSGTTSVTSTSSTAINTVAGEMLIVIVGSYNGGTATNLTLTISDTLGGLAWTQIQGNNSTSFAAPAIFWAIATATTSGKVTVANTGTSTLVMQPWQVSNQGSSPIVQTINTTGYAASFPSPPNANSLVMTVFQEANASTPTNTQPNGFTSMISSNYAPVYLQAAQMNGLAYQNIMWAESGVTTAAPALLAIEIQPGPRTAMNVGTSATDLTLYNELGRAKVSAVTSSPPGSSGTANTFYQFQFGAQTATFTLTEAGVFANASSTVGTGSLLDHALFIPQFTWTAGDTLTMTAEFTWSNPT